MYEKVNPNEALEVFVKVFLPIVDKHAPVNKLTVRTVTAFWIDDKLKMAWFKEIR